MASPFIGEIRMFAGTFAPQGWALCQGQLLSIASNDALFSLLGTIYGGDGRTTFGLPDLRGRCPMHYGSGPGLTSRTIGQKSGTETNTLSVNQTGHIHALSPPAGQSEGNSHDPTDNYPAAGEEPVKPYTNTPNTAMGSFLSEPALGPGNNVNNMPPVLAINFIIALIGVYPSRA